LRVEHVDRSPAHDRDEADPPDEAVERVTGSGERERVVGIVDDRRERAVEVDQDGCPRRRARERLEEGGQLPTRTTQLACSRVGRSVRPAGNGSIAAPA
jgi:hypothetical protein